MKQIKLTQGESAIVDDVDFHWLNRWKWHIDGRGYASRLTVINGKYHRIYMHRLINNTPSNKYTDHINGNKLDNRRANLRSVTNKQNLRKQKIRSTSTTGYKGVSYEKSKGKYRTSIQVDGKQVLICYFDNPRHAALAYDLWAEDLYGEFANTNF